MPLPDWAKNIPQIDEYEQFFLKCFKDIGSRRFIPGHGVNQISWFDIEEYCNIRKLSFDQKMDVHQIIPIVDEAYLKQINRNK